MKCSLRTCPALTCKYGIIPANVIAGQCCDRCLPKKENTKTKDRNIQSVESKEDDSNGDLSSEEPARRCAQCLYQNPRRKGELFREFIF